jgi:hemerythrin-like domain-containing protein
MIQQTNMYAVNAFGSRPIDMVRCFHNALRRDIAQIDSAVLSIARSGGDLNPLFEKLHLHGEVLDYHARGEEAAVFPAIDKLTPSVAQAYLIDHRELDNMVNGLDPIHKAPDLLTSARATAVLQSHLRIHLDKEDAHLYPILRERTNDEEQNAIGKTMSSKIPPEKFPTIVQWLFPLLETKDQIIMTKGWMSLMPAPVFAKAKQLIKTTVGERWAILTQQIPELISNT